MVEFSVLVWIFQPCQAMETRTCCGRGKLEREQKAGDEKKAFGNQISSHHQSGVTEAHGCPLQFNALT